ncbi:hypothetical protein [Croceicoccus sp. YJ47]|uniref:hypothetical protein n=1 Tax=Croceicoccus sp. YJ47 TaxID=2798724 RepID=UPI0019226509|nr:hypothetical protein [Croceicoccus sp. YJ47]QQN74131.1 hypothetical protein JD971_15600 [Croceicoccus sp. YJ47]
MSDRKARSSPEIETINENGLMIFFDRDRTDISSLPPAVAGLLSPVSIGQSECVHPRYLFGVDGATLSNAVCFLLRSEYEGLNGLRDQVAAALRISDTTGCLAVGWARARTAMGVGYFRSVAQSWLDGGAFPALGLTALHLDENGVMQSVGVRALTGWEVAVAPAPGMSHAQQAKVATRFIDHIIRDGLSEDESGVEIDGMGKFRVQPRRDYNIVYLLR